MSKAVHRTLQAKLAALDGPEWDSSDDEETPAIPLASTKTSKTHSKSQQQNKSKTDSPTNNNNDSDLANSRVIYLGHLPPNFEEPELAGFLRQFGTVTRLRLSRSKRTANSRGYAFCEFANARVAAIVADTMSGYLMSQKRLVCNLVPPDRVHPRMFDGHDRKWRKVDWRGMHRDRVNENRTVDRMQRITQQLLKREKQKRQALKEMGMDYDFPGYEESAKNVMKLGAKENESPASNKAADEERISKKRKGPVDDGGFEQADAKRGIEDGHVPASKSEEKKLAKKHRKHSEESDDTEPSSKPKKRRKSSDASSEQVEIVSFKRNKKEVPDKGEKSAAEKNDEGRKASSDQVVSAKRKKEVEKSGGEKNDKGKKPSSDQVASSKRKKELTDNLDKSAGEKNDKGKKSDSKLKKGRLSLDSNEKLEESMTSDKKKKKKKRRAST